MFSELLHLVGSWLVGAGVSCVGRRVGSRWCLLLIYIGGERERNKHSHLMNNMAQVYHAYSLAGFPCYAVTLASEPRPSTSISENRPRTIISRYILRTHARGRPGFRGYCNTM